MDSTLLRFIPLAGSRFHLDRWAVALFLSWMFIAGTYSCFSYHAPLSHALAAFAGVGLTGLLVLALTWPKR